MYFSLFNSRVSGTQTTMLIGKQNTVFYTQWRIHCRRQNTVDKHKHFIEKSAKNWPIYRKLQSSSFLTIPVFDFWFYRFQLLCFYSFKTETYWSEMSIHPDHWNLDTRLKTNILRATVTLYSAHETFPPILFEFSCFLFEQDMRPVATHEAVRLKRGKKN